MKGLGGLALVVALASVPVSAAAVGPSGPRASAFRQEPVAAPAPTSTQARSDDQPPAASKLRPSASAPSAPPPRAAAPAAGQARPSAPSQPSVDLVEVQELIPDLVIDFRYATEDNFMGKAVYPKDATCLLQRSVALRLQKVADKLRAEDGTRLRVFDCYRPLHVQWEMWKIFPKPGYVAPPKGGSVHNRGAAVDLTLAAPDGSALPMPTDFDTFTEKAWQASTDGTPEELRNRNRLREAMKGQGFLTIRKEWWHYEAPDRRSYPVLDLPFDVARR